MNDMPSIPLPARRLASAWFALALGALGLSALFAVVLVVARTPFLGQGAGLFRTALVLHVDLAVLVWFLAVAAGIWSLGAQTALMARWALWWLAVAGTLALVTTPLTGDALPLLSNYVPLLDHPLFLAGGLFFGIAVAITGLLALPWLLRADTTWRLPAALAVFALCVALAVLLTSLFGDTNGATGPLGIDDQLWGLGHTLQFVHVLLLMGAWCALGSAALARIPSIRAALPGLFALATLPLLAAPIVVLIDTLGTVEYRQHFTELMRWGTWPGATLLGIALAVGLNRLRRERALTVEEQGLTLSLLLFGGGCLLGAAIRGETLIVPAHYHATVGAATLAYLAWLLQLGRTTGIIGTPTTFLIRLPLLYGVGIVVLVAGLSGAGYLGIPRKAAHAELNTGNPLYLSTMSLAGVGGFLALVAICLVVGLTFRAAYHARRAATPNPGHKDKRPLAIVLTMLMVAGGGLLLDGSSADKSKDLRARRQHAADKIKADVTARFQQGVIMLHAKQYDHAMTAFHRVMQLAPEMPEAYVNMGYALLGLKRYREAADFFESATLLRRSQANAYYGLAIALEGMGDLPGALGAMQTFIHLGKADDPFRIKAEAAIWEWRTALDARRGNQRPN